MFIEVAKITEVHKKAKDTTVINPVSSFQPKEIKIVMETIRRDEIKSVRKWHKSGEEETKIEGDVTMVYLIGDKSRSSAEMKINESYDSFTRRLAVVKIED